MKRPTSFTTAVQKIVQHACSVVYVPNPVLVDLAYRQFDVKHRKIVIRTDREIFALFTQWRKELNCTYTYLYS